MSAVEQPVESGDTEVMVMNEEQLVIILHLEFPKVLLLNRSGLVTLKRR